MMYAVIVLTAITAFVAGWLSCDIAQGWRTRKRGH